MILYEYPLNERVRTLLRLEDLYDRVRFFLGHDSAHDHHACLTGMFEILEVASRAYVLDNGAIVLQGNAAQVRDDPNLKRAYLGM